jgi:hypothetical protein
MTTRAEWLEYHDMTPTRHARDLITDLDVAQLLASLRERSAEEVLLYPSPVNENDRDRELNFQLDAAKKHACVTYGQRELGVFQTVGNPDAPELYTSSGGSFSAGTAVPIADLERALTEFLRTGERPTCLEWIEED